MISFKTGCRALQAVSLMGAALCLATPAAAQSRGELLYTTHCGACHGAQMHWRDKKRVHDWPSLRAQVRLWQAQATLAWSEDDIDQVARYLNEAYYHLPSAPDQTGQSTARSRTVP